MTPCAVGRTFARNDTLNDLNWTDPCDEQGMRILLAVENHGDVFFCESHGMAVVELIKILETEYLEKTGPLRTNVCAAGRWIVHDEDIWGLNWRDHCPHEVASVIPVGPLGIRYGFCGGHMMGILNQITEALLDDYAPLDECSCHRDGAMN